MTTTTPDLKASVLAILQAHSCGVKVSAHVVKRKNGGTVQVKMKKQKTNKAKVIKPITTYKAPCYWDTYEKVRLNSCGTVQITRHKKEKK